MALRNLFLLALAGLALAAPAAAQDAWKRETVMSLSAEFPAGAVQRSQEIDAYGKKVWQAAVVGRSASGATVAVVVSQVPDTDPQRNDPAAWRTTNLGTFANGLKMSERVSTRRGTMGDLETEDAVYRSADGRLFEGRAVMRGDQAALFGVVHERQAATPSPEFTRLTGSARFER